MEITSASLCKFEVPFRAMGLGEWDVGLSICCGFSPYKHTRLLISNPVTAICLRQAGDHMEWSLFIYFWGWSLGAWLSFHNLGPLPCNQPFPCFYFVTLKTQASTLFPYQLFIHFLEIAKDAFEVLKGSFSLTWERWVICAYNILFLNLEKGISKLKLPSS